MIPVLVIVLVLGGIFIKNYGDLLGINLIKPTPYKYVSQAFTFMDSQGIYKDDKAWPEKKAELLEEAKKMTSYEACYSLIDEALEITGGKHSQLIRPSNGEEAFSEMPEVELLENEIAYIRLPEFSGTTEEGEEYANQVNDFLSDNRDSLNGAIIDIRDNHGGNMGPMVSAVSSLLPDGDLMYFGVQGTKMEVTLENGTVSGGGTTVSLDNVFKIEGIPVAILQNQDTGSSAEAVRICFWDLDNVRSFGTETAGYCSSNNVRKLYDGATILLTIGNDIARNGDEFCEDPIPVDEETKTPVEDAIKWINNN